MREYSHSGFFKKYLLPVISGILVLTLYYLVIEEYQLNKGDFYGAIFVVAHLVIELIHKQEGPDIPMNWLDKMFKYYFAHNVPDTVKPGFNINDGIDDESFIISYSKSKLRFHYVGLVIMTLVAGYFLIKEQLYVIAGWLAFNMGKGIYNNGVDVNDEGPKIIMKKEPPATPQLGFVKWEDIKLIQFRDTNSGDSTNLDIFLTPKEKWKHPEFTIMIDNLDKRKKEISMKITEFYGTPPQKA